ncbi:MAG: DUF4440 domain-containing protein [Chloroflexota bacterium]
MSDLTNTDDTQAIKAAFQRWQDAWNRGDLEGFLESYWQSEQVRYVSGNQMMMGYETIAATYRQRYLAEDAPGMGQMQLEVEPDFIAGDDALVFGRYKALDDDQQVIGHGAFTVHLRRIDGEWKIVSDHASALG